MSHVARRSFWQNEAKRVDCAAARMTSAIQPQQGEGEAALDCIRGFPVGNGQDREVRRTAAKEAAGVVAGNGMLNGTILS